MNDILFKRQISSLSKTYANLCVVCLHLHPKLIENHLQSIVDLLQPSNEYLSIFLIAYIDLYSQMRSLTKLPKRLINIFPKSSILPDNVLDHYRLCISKCSHTLVDEIWSSLLDQFDQHLIIIQLISSLLNGYRLFDLNISREILLEQNQLKFNRTLEKLRSQVTDSIVRRFSQKKNVRNSVVFSWHRLTARFDRVFWNVISLSVGSRCAFSRFHRASRQSTTCGIITDFCSLKVNGHRSRPMKISNRYSYELIFKKFFRNEFMLF